MSTASTSRPNPSPGMSIDLQAIRSCLLNLPHEALTSSSPTHLPTTFPLAFPSPLHTLNLLTTLHLVHLILSQPSHSRYFAETSPPSNPRDTALRGVMGLFLASDDDWSASNLLSSQAWSSDKLDENKVAEFFGIQLVREKQHDSITAIRIGERWEPAVNLAGALVELFKGSGKAMHQGEKKCLGEGVQAAVQATFGKGERDIERFTAVLLEGILGGSPSASDNITATDASLRTASLRLLQDLSYRQSTFSDIDPALPPLAELADISPLPLSIPVLLQLGIVALPENQITRSSSSSRTQVALPRKDIDLLALAEPGSSSSSSSSGARQKGGEDVGPVVIELSTEEIEELQQASVRACEIVRREVAGSDNAEEGNEHDQKGSSSGKDLESWKKNMTFLDWSRVSARLEEIMLQHGLDVRVVQV